MKAFLCLLVLICSTFVIDAHNWLDTPISRGNQRQSQTGCRYGGEGNPTCAGPCDRTVSQMTIPATPVQRGSSITVKWNRHNHPGGFIRFAWSPTSQSDAHSSFDAHVDQFFCKDIGGCGPADPNSPAGDPNGLLCGTTIQVPLYLTNGAWTLQWAYFGGYYNAGDYYACVDYVINGGPTGNQNAVTYTGGDFSYPNENVCLFYSTNALHVCTAEPCLNGTFPPGNQKGAVLGFSANTGSGSGNAPVTTASTTAAAPLTTASTTARATPVTTASTTARANPVTTASTTARANAVTTASTTAHANPVTTASTTAHANAVTTASTTGAQAPMTTGTTTGAFVPPNPSGSNCAGQISSVSASQAVMTYVDTWGSGSSASYRAVIEIDVQEPVLANWKLQYVFPSNQINPVVTSAVNAGSLKCQTNQGSLRHAVIKPAGWASTVYSGTSLTIEVIGTNAGGLSSSDIIANTQLMVYT